MPTRNCAGPAATFFTMSSHTKGRDGSQPSTSSPWADGGNGARPNVTYAHAPKAELRTAEQSSASRSAALKPDLCGGSVDGSPLRAAGPCRGSNRVGPGEAYRGSTTRGALDALGCALASASMGSAQ